MANHWRDPAVAGAAGADGAPGPAKIVRRVAPNVQTNQAATDVAVFTALPAKCRLTKVAVFDASANLATSIATLAVYDAAAAGGLALVTAAGITALTAATKCLDMTVLKTDYSTSTTVVVRNVTAALAPATVSIAIEVEDLT